MNRVPFVKAVQMILALGAALSLLSAGARGQTFQVIYNFAGGTTDGANPVDAGNLTFDSSGNLYGTTELGGACGLGTLFELSPNGSGGWTETVLHSFCGRGAQDGAYPIAAPFFSAEQVLGSAPYGGTSGEGIIYGWYWPTGPYFNFSLQCESGPYGGGCFPYTTPSTQPVGSAGFSGILYAFYGGGTYNRGVIDIAFSGYSYSFCLFSSCPDGSNPGSALTLDNALNAYGTTRLGGAGDQGVVYECVAQPGGLCSETVLHSFAGGTSDGAYPFLATLALTESCPPNGICLQTIWGTTPSGGASAASDGLGYGTVFNMNSAFGFGLVHSFDFYDGAYPYAGLTNLNGTFYGTTLQGGPFQRECCPVGFRAGQGTIYSLTSTGTLTTLHTFGGSDGASPYSGLVADSNGNLYGVTYAGGAHGYGVVYEITP